MGARDPYKRKTCDDILKLAWKEWTKSISFSKARKNFKQHVLTKKLQRHSLDTHMRDKSLASKKVYFRNKNRNINQSKNKVMSFDDMHQTQQQKDVIAADKRSKIINAFRGHRQSKGTEELLELQKRENLYAIHESDDGDEERKDPFDTLLLVKLISKKEYLKQNYKNIVALFTTRQGLLVLNELMSNAQIVEWRQNEKKFDEYCNHIKEYKAWAKIHDRYHEKWKFIQAWI